jgi:hypothetical protein
MQKDKLVALWIEDTIDPTGRVHVRDVRGIHPRPHGGPGDLTATIQVQVPGESSPREERFVVELKSRSEPSTIRSFLERAPRDLTHPLLMSAPRIGGRSGDLLAERRISWLDASGNYHLRMGDSVLERSGLAEPDRPSRPQRLAFAPKGSRLTRLLLAYPERSWLTTEIAQTAGIDAGYASRTLTLLREAGYVSREKKWRLMRADALLEDWSSGYRFDRHDSQTYFSLTPRVESRMRELVDAASPKGTDIAFTGSSAAALWGALTAGDDVVAYVRDAESRADMVRDLGLAPESEAPNLTLVVPEDRGVFVPIEPRQDIPLVSRPQIYVDLVRSSRGPSLAPDFLEQMPWRG